MGKKNKKIKSDKVAPEEQPADEQRQPEAENPLEAFKPVESCNGYGSRVNKRHSFTRISVDPSRKYHQPKERESWGPNVKGKKFRKEKGKKKRCPNAGQRIDGQVRSIRFN